MSTGHPPKIPNTACISLPTQPVVDLGWLNKAPDLAGHFVRRYETGWRPVRGLVGEAIGHAARVATFNRRCLELVTKICQTEAASSCDVVLAVLDCPTVIAVASDVARRLQKPLVVLVWDAPELLVRQLQLDRWSAASLLKEFANTSRRAERVGVIGEQMRDAYQQQFGSGKYIILRHGISESLWRERAETSEKVVIGFAGSITAVQYVKSK